MPTQAALSTSTAMTLVTADHPKGQKAVEVFRAKYNQARLDDESAQRLNESPEFAAAIADAIAKFSVTNQYADEERPSNYGYISGYKPRSITEQTNRLRELFPGIGYANEALAEQPLPQGAEGHFAMPRWDLIGKTYTAAAEIVWLKLKETRKGKFYNYRDGQLGPDRLRQSAKSAAMWERLGQAQEGNNLLVVPAQFGIRHRGRSVRRAREVMSGVEFGLGMFAVGIMLLTHPERLQHYDDLWVDMAGDEYHDPQCSGAPFDHAPCFNFYDGRLRFGTVWSGRALGDYGSASGWSVPQE